MPQQCGVQKEAFGEPQFFRFFLFELYDATTHKNAIKWTSTLNVLCSGVFA